MKIVLIGAGNLATHLGKALHAAGHDMVQVFSRTMQSAETLASLLDAEPLTDIAQVRDDADVYIFSVKDSALEQLISQLCGGEKKVFDVGFPGTGAALWRALSDADILKAARGGFQHHSLFYRGK